MGHLDEGRLAILGSGVRSFNGICVVFLPSTALCVGLTLLFRLLCEVEVSSDGELRRNWSFLYRKTHHDKCHLAHSRSVDAVTRGCPYP